MPVKKLSNRLRGVLTLVVLSICGITMIQCSYRGLPNLSAVPLNEGETIIILQKNGHIKDVFGPEVSGIQKPKWVKIKKDTSEEAIAYAKNRLKELGFPEPYENIDIRVISKNPLCVIYGKVVRCP